MGNHAGALLSGLQTTLEQPPREMHHGEELLRGSKSTLEQIPPGATLLLEEIPGKKAHGLAPFLKSAL
jgi:hypothetical protein